MSFIRQGKTSWKFLAIIGFLIALFIFAGIFIFFNYGAGKNENFSTSKIWSAALRFLVLGDGGISGDSKLLELSFNEGSGTLLHDSSGSNNNATINGATSVWTKLPTGKWVVSFPGSGSNLSCAYSESLDISGADAKITLETWVNMEKDESSMWMGTGIGGSQGGYAFYYHQPNGKVEGYLEGLDPDNHGWKAIAISAVPTETNHWYHVVYTYDGNFGKIYIDGSQIRQSEAWTGGIFASAPSQPFKTWNSFKGMFGKIAVYNYALSQTQINNIYQAEKKNYFQVPSSASIYVVPAITDNKILPDNPISSQYISNNINLDGSPGEYRPASFAVYALNEISSMTITASNLTGSGGTINSNLIDVKVVKAWYQSGDNTYVGSNKIKLFTPELLLKDDSLVKVENKENYLKLTSGNYIWISEIKSETGFKITPTGEMSVQDSASLLPVDIPAGTNKQFWITIKIPKTATAGTYNGTIQLKNSAGQIGNLNVQLKVLPIQLAKPIFDYSLYYRGQLNSSWPQGSISSEWKSETQMRAELENMFSHGVTNPTVYQSFEKLKNVLAMRQSVGMTGPLLFLGLTHASFGNDLSALKKAVASLAETVSGYNGIADYYIYGRDEQELTSNDRAQISAVHEAGGKVFNAQNKNMADSTDILDIIVSSGVPDSSLATKSHSYGNKIYNYGNPQAGEEHPEKYRRNYGLLLWQKDYDGASTYAYQHSFADIWNDFDSATYRDHNFTYPTINGVIDTIQWEGFREGVNDIKYLSTLLNVIKSAKSSGKNTSAAESWVANLKNTNLATANLDNIRSQMITYILSLQSGGTPEPEGECTNDCISGQTKCSDTTHKQTCGQNDSDTCLEWSTATACSGSTACGYGNCPDTHKPTWRCELGTCVYVCNTSLSCTGEPGEESPVTTCTNDCTTGQLKCSDTTHKQTCGQYDPDTCLEWSTATACSGSAACGYGNCPVNQKPSWSCKDGKCVYTCASSANCNISQAYVKNYRKSCYNNSVYWYDSTGQIQGIYEKCEGKSCVDAVCVASSSAVADADDSEGTNPSIPEIAEIEKAQSFLDSIIQFITSHILLTIILVVVTYLVFTIAGFALFKRMAG